MASKPWKQSYLGTRKEIVHWTNDELNTQILSCKIRTIKFLSEKGLLKTEQQCPTCSRPMIKSSCPPTHFVEEVRFRCRKKHFDSAANGECNVNVGIFILLPMIHLGFWEQAGLTSQHSIVKCSLEKSLFYFFSNFELGYWPHDKQVSVKRFSWFSGINITLAESLKVGVYEQSAFLARQFSVFA